MSAKILRSRNSRTMPNKKTMITAAAIDSHAPANVASVKSLEIGASRGQDIRKRIRQPISQTFAKQLTDTNTMITPDLGIFL